MYPHLHKPKNIQIDCLEVLFLLCVMFVQQNKTCSLQLCCGWKKTCSPNPKTNGSYEGSLLKNPSHESGKTCYEKGKQMHCETKPKQYVQGFFQGQSNLKKKNKAQQNQLGKIMFHKKRSKLLTLHVPWHCLSWAILQQLWNSRFGKHGIHFLENKAACSWKGASCNIFWERTHVRSWKAAPCNVLGQGD